VKQALAGLKEIDTPYQYVVLEPTPCDSKAIKDRYYVMIIETHIDCLDFEQTEVYRYKYSDEPADPIFPQASIFKLVIHADKVGDYHIFREKNNTRSIIVSEEVKRRLEAVGTTGVIFDPVC